MVALSPFLPVGRRSPSSAPQQVRGSPSSAPQQILWGSLAFVFLPPGLCFSSHYTSGSEKHWEQGCSGNEWISFENLLSFLSQGDILINSVNFASFRENRETMQPLFCIGSRQAESWTVCQEFHIKMYVQTRTRLQSASQKSVVLDVRESFRGS